MQESMSDSGRRAHRIALVHPTYWPEVRRGSERVIHDLAIYLASRGFEPTIVTGHRGRPSRRLEEGIPVLRSWRPPTRLQPRRLEPYANHAPVALASLVRRQFDLVHAFHLPNAAAAALWSGIFGRPLVVSLMGFPDRTSIRGFRGRERTLRFAASHAAALHVLSEAARSVLIDATGLESQVIPPGTRVAAFEIEVPRERRPTVFCASSAMDPRKGVPELVEAFGILRRQLPDARLLITGPVPEELGPRLQATDVETISAWIDQTSLARTYASAWLTVLPSVREAFGQVLVESLAAGTPVVAVRSGAASEIVDSPEVGVLCGEPDPSALAGAMAAGLELARRTDIRESCRAHAARWDWDRVGPRFEALYGIALGSGP
jgi:glycosyltransferase involved in cell wall biosynthesis